VADLVTRACFDRQDHEVIGEELPSRARKWYRETARRLLTRHTVERMGGGIMAIRHPYWLHARRITTRVPCPRPGSG
jgi:hypothetical protein